MPGRSACVAVGGMMGLVGARFLGRRRIRSGAHDVPMMGLGAMLLMFCWFGFNLGSVPSYGNMAADLPLVAINTLAAMAGGIVGSLVISSFSEGKSSPIITPNGGLAGAVAICSGVHLVHPLFAILIGVVAGAQIPITSRWISKALKVDDPCDVGPVHAIPGLLGGIAAGLWAPMDSQWLSRIHRPPGHAVDRHRRGHRLRHHGRSGGLRRN